MTKKDLKNNYDEIAELYKNGVTLRKIGKKYDIGHASIKSILVDLGIYEPNRKVLSKDIPECEHQNIIDMYKNGVDILEIAKKYGVGHGLIRKILKYYNIDIIKKHRTSSYQVNEYYFDKIDNQDKAYTLGLLYADGYNIDKRHLVGIELQERDSYIIEQIRYNMDSNFPIIFKELSNKNPNWKNHKILNIINPHLSETLNNLGVIPRKSLKLTFPIFLADDMMPHFLRGYLDGDGHIPKNKYSYDAQFISTKSFCEQAQKYLKEKLNIDSVVKLNIKDESSKRYNGITSTLFIKGKESSKKFFNYIYKDANMFLTRKYETYASKFNNYTYLD